MKKKINFKNHILYDTSNSRYCYEDALGQITENYIDLLMISRKNTEQRTA